MYQCNNKITDKLNISNDVRTSIFSLTGMRRNEEKLLGSFMLRELSFASDFPAL
jgi:hypothetical protein